jgi:hypothetical protein
MCKPRYENESSCMERELGIEIYMIIKVIHGMFKKIINDILKLIYSNNFCSNISDLDLLKEKLKMLLYTLIKFEIMSNLTIVLPTIISLIDILYYPINTNTISKKEKDNYIQEIIRLVEGQLLTNIYL